MTMLKSRNRCLLHRLYLSRLPRLSRYECRNNRCYHELSYVKSGPPKTHLEYYQAPSVRKEDAWVAPWDGRTRWAKVEMIAAPWNPADALAVHGLYPSPWEECDPGGRAAFSEAICRSAYDEERRVAGSEGWGRVVDLYPDPKDSRFVEVSLPAHPLQIGDFVVPGISRLGTLRSSLWAPETHWIRLKRGQELYDAQGPFSPAALFQTGGTAMRMLHDFSLLLPGDVVVQNAGNSAVGFMVSQIAAEIMNVDCISLIRTGNRTPEQVEQLQDYLKKRGKATMVLTEESISKESVADIYNSIMIQRRQMDSESDTPKQPLPLNVRLALNAVGGSSVQKLLLFLHNHGTLVTYGSMSREPILVEPSEFIFRNIELAGYWHSRWMVQQHRLQDDVRSSEGKVEDARMIMLNALVDAVLDQRLECPPVQTLALQEFHQAFAAPSETPTMRRKVVFDCREDTKQPV